MEKYNSLEFCKNYIKTWLGKMEGDVNLSNRRSWHNSSEWTIKHLTILYDLARGLGYILDDEKQSYGCSVQQEYYRVDFTLYNHIKDSYWNLDYAIEHENEKYYIKKNKLKKKGWFDEFAKLLPLKCRNSRVIIGYEYFYEEGEEYYEECNSIKRKIKNCEDLLNNKEVQQSMANSPILLILFPNTEKMRKIGNGQSKTNILRMVEFTCDTSSGIWSSRDLAQDALKEYQERLISVYKQIVDKK